MESDTFVFHRSVPNCFVHEKYSYVYILCVAIYFRQISSKMKTILATEKVDIPDEGILCFFRVLLLLIAYHKIFYLRNMSSFAFCLRSTLTFLMFTTMANITSASFVSTLARPHWSTQMLPTGTESCTLNFCRHC